MDSVSTLNQVMGLLRQQLAERNRSTERASPQKDASTRVSRPDPDSPGTREMLAARVGTLRTGGIGDPARLSRSVIEWLLAREFGASIINDPEFQQMVDQVNESILGDAEGAASMKQLLFRAAT
ncbi:hypothetical protein ACAX43_21160 [Paraburkholderia sp. IW21]|uniref:hypothetical protein n=1 Tax=Paraburkholderia sp. IW21 TaxID=3242488 RepID=UPI00352051C3